MATELSTTLSNPEEINSILDLLKYAWVAGIYWAKQILDRLKIVEDKQAISPTLKEVEERVDKELARVITKLDKVESLLIGLIQRQALHPETTRANINLGE